MTTMQPKKLLDDFTFQMVGRFFVERASARLVWAENDLAQRFGALEDVDTGCAEKAEPHVKCMQETLQCIAGIEPKTIGGCKALLEAAIELVQTRQTEDEASVLVDDEALLRILIGVKGALEWSDDPEAPISSFRPRT